MIFKKGIRGWINQLHISPLLGLPNLRKIWASSPRRYDGACSARGPLIEMKLFVSSLHSAQINLLHNSKYITATSTALSKLVNAHGDDIGDAGTMYLESSCAFLYWYSFHDE